MVAVTNKKQETLGQFDAALYLAQLLENASESEPTEEYEVFMQALKATKDSCSNPNPKLIFSGQLTTEGLKFTFAFE